MTTIGIDLDALGLDDLAIEPETTTDGAAEPTPGASFRDKPLIKGSVLSRSLYQVMSGAPLTIIKSPPGGGKTTMLAELVTRLADRANLKIVLAGPTKNGCAELANRINELLGDDESGNPRILWGITTEMAQVNLPQAPKNKKEREAAAARGDMRPVIRTVASCEASAPECDVLIIDEAYQTTYRAIAVAADKADQVVLVGDPGQIGPVVSSDMTYFKGRDRSPDMRAPEVFEKFDAALTLPLECTYRLGQETVDAIAPLYPFKFESRRPDRWIASKTGERISEIVSVEIDPIATPADLPLMERIAAYAGSLVGLECHTVVDGVDKVAALESGDVAVVVAHNAQSSAIKAILSSRGLPGVVVGTADSLQGGQWPAVIALDPMVGYTAPGAHQLATGRLCVMASRHMAHLTWVHDGEWVNAEPDSNGSLKDFRNGQKVRRALTA